MEEHCSISNGRSVMFSGKHVERLQLALLHIEHLPENHSLHKNDLGIWVEATPERRLKASPIVGEWYNTV